MRCGDGVRGVALVVVLAAAPSQTAARAATAGAATAHAAAAHAATAPEGAPPNVVLIVADDVGYGDVCAYGCSEGRTPKLDALAADGIRFTSGYVSAPLCSPTRAGLMTGRYQQRFGHEFGAGGIERVEREGLGTTTEERMLPALLHGAGYRSALIGKWHLGSQAQFHPLSRGFDEFYGFLHGGQLYFDATDRPDVVVAPSVSKVGAEEPPRRIALNPMLRGREPVEETTYLTEAFTREAVDFIERNRERPFFLYLAYNATHTPLQATRERYDRFADIADPRRRVGAAMLSALDDGVGAVRRAIAEAGIAERTLVIFLSDNGCPTYTGACSNGELLGGKLTPFEGGVRVPFMAAWPTTIEAGHVEDAPVSSLDVFPTVLALAGVEPPGDRAIDGRSLLPLLRGQDGAAEELAGRTLYWRNRENFAVRSGCWKLVGMNREHTFLFDLAESIGERRDLATAKPEIVRELLESFRRWEEQMRPPLWSPVSESTLDILLPWTGRKQGFRVTV